MNKTIFTTENLLRALGLILLLLVILISRTSLFPNLIPDNKLIYVTITGAILLVVAYYLRHKRLNTSQEEYEEEA